MAQGKSIAVIALLLCGYNTLPALAQSGEDILQYVNPLIGTANGGRRIHRWTTTFLSNT